MTDNVSAARERLYLEWDNKGGQAETLHDIIGLILDEAVNYDWCDSPDKVSIIRDMKKCCLQCVICTE